MCNRERLIRFPLRGPGALESRIARAVVPTLTGTGAAFLIWSGVIHLELWRDGYSDIAVEFTAALVLLAAAGLLALSGAARAAVRRASVPSHS
jgi:hypothetical protein